MIIPVALLLPSAVIAQLVLPVLVARRLRTRLQKDGEVLSVKVGAFPAIKLLWGRADTLDISLGSFDSTPQQMLAELEQGGDVRILRLRIAALRAGLLKLYDTAITVHGDELSFAAQIKTADLQRALPVLSSLTPALDDAGQLTLRGTVTVLGASVSVRAALATKDGRVVISGPGPLAALGTITLFSAPGLHFNSVDASQMPDGLSVRGTATFQPVSAATTAAT